MSTGSDARHDRVIVAGLRLGDPAGARLLDRAYRARLLTFCFRYLGRWEDAEDVVQEVMGAALIADDLPESLRPWLFTVARNRSLNMLRARGRRPERALESQAGLVASLTGLLTGLVKEERRQRLQSVLRELSAEQAEILRLRYTERLGRAEIAEILGIPTGRVKSRLFEAVEALRRNSETG